MRCSLKLVATAIMKAIMRRYLDHEGKKQINTKEEQKIILGRSSDFSDAYIMREWFELQPVVRKGFMKRAN